MQEAIITLSIVKCRIRTPVLNLERMVAMRFSFMGKHEGSHPDEQKSRTNKLAIVDASVPKIMVFPVSMHIGAPAKPIVEVGDKIKAGEMIAEAGGFVSAPIYSSVSGEVIAIEKRTTTKGETDCIIVKNDYEYTKAEPIVEPGHSHEMSNEDIINTVRKAGIVGMGGATFPTSVKLSPPPGAVIDTIIINGAECEPYSTSDHRVMLEYADEIISGINIVRRLFPKLRQVFIGVTRCD